MDTILKRLVLLELLDGGIVLPLADGAAADTPGEREALLGVYPFSDTTDTGPPPPAVVAFSGTLIVQPASITATLFNIPRTTVRPVPETRTTTVGWSDLVRQAEGSEYASRGRYSSYSFGNGRRTRNFYSNTDGT